MSYSVITQHNQSTGSLIHAGTGGRFQFHMTLSDSFRYIAFGIKLPLMVCDIRKVAKLTVDLKKRRHGNNTEVFTILTTYFILSSEKLVLITRFR